MHERTRIGTDADVHARTRTDEDGRGRCVHIIKSPDASARIISDMSGRVFRPRTFEVYYMYLEVAGIARALALCQIARTEHMCDSLIKCTQGLISLYYHPKLYILRMIRADSTLKIISTTLV